MVLLYHSDGVEKPVAKPVENAVGIDAGLLNWITLSNGGTIQNTLNHKAQTQEIKNLQRQLSSKKKGSKNREKARIRLAKAWRRIRQSRDDFVHKTSTKKAEEYVQ